MTLILACLSSGGWTRSLRVADDIYFASIHLVSVHGGVFVEELSDLPGARSFGFKSRGASGYLNVYHDQELRHVWKWRNLGVAIGRREIPSQALNDKRIPTKRYYYVRYYVPFIMLTMLSSYLLLSTPRQKPSAPQPDVQA